MLRTYPRSTFHHTILYLKLGPAPIFMRVAVFPSTVLLASLLLLVCDLVAILLWDILSVNKKIKYANSMKYVKKLDWIKSLMKQLALSIFIFKKYNQLPSSKWVLHWMKIIFYKTAIPYVTTVTSNPVKEKRQWAKIMLLIYLVKRYCSHLLSKAKTTRKFLNWSVLVAYG